MIGKGKIHLVEQDFTRFWTFSKALRCEKCDISIKEASAGLFSFNNPIGACPECRGFGRTLGIDLMKALPDQDLSLKEGVVKPFQGERGLNASKILSLVQRLEALISTYHLENFQQRIRNGFYTVKRVTLRQIGRLVFGMVFKVSLVG